MTDKTNPAQEIEPRKDKVALLVKQTDRPPLALVHNRADRLVRLIELDAPAIVIRSEMRMLLEAIEAYKWRAEP